MHRLTKWFITALITGFISTSIYASGGGERETSAPFPVPLSCYSENYGSSKFYEEGCDRVHGIENYRDPEGGSVIDILCLLYTSPSPRDLSTSRMPSSA